MTTAARPREAQESRSPEALGTRGSLIGLWLIFGASFVLYLVLALRSPLPVIDPDEFRYAHLARSLADGTGFVWRSEHVAQSAALYIYVLAPLWAIFKSTTTAYDATKVLDVALMSAQVIPVYLLGRSVIGPRWALVPAGLTVAGTSMVITAHVLTENLGIPLATTATCLLAMTLYSPRNLTGFLALGFALGATWARLQLGVLVAIFVGALIADVLMRPADDRQQRLQEHRYYLIAGTAIAVIGGLFVLVAPNATGNYSDLFGSHPAAGRALLKTALELGGMVCAGGLLPVLIVGAGSVRRRNWLDPTIAPLLTVFWLTALITCLQAGLFLSSVHTQRDVWWGIERYVVYALPVGYIAAIALLKLARIEKRDLLVAAVFAALLVLHPAGVAVSEERAAWSVAYRVHGLVPLGTGPALALVGGLTVLLLWLALRRFGLRAMAPAAALITLAVMVVQDQASWHYLTNVTRTFRSSFPADLEWIDHHTKRPTAFINVTSTAPTAPALDFFNRRLVAAYGPPRGLEGLPLSGRTCTWVVDPNGRMQFQPECGPTPHTFFNNDPRARITFAHETFSATDPRIGRLTETDPAFAPQLRTLVILPCPRATPSFSLTKPSYVPASAPIKCAPGLAGLFHLDSRATLVVTYIGGGTSQIVQSQSRTWRIPPRRRTDVRIPLAIGGSQLSLNHSWRVNVGNPRIATMRLVSADGQSTSLL